MSYTFICTTEKEWYLKITNIENLMMYWNEVFNPRLRQALDTIYDTKEFGARGCKHCDSIQAMIGFKSRGERISYEEAHDEIVYDVRKAQYKALCDGKAVYINRNMGWNALEKNIEQFVHRTSFDFPKMKKEFLKIERFPLGTHFYVFIDGIQLRKDDY